MRSVTYALQSVLSGNDDFCEWYGRQQDTIKKDPINRFFHNFRNKNLHIGENPVQSVSFGSNQESHYWFRPTPDIQNVPTDDVETCCRKYMVNILTVVYDCYSKFGPLIDAHQRYTSDYFASIGKTVEDAEDELGLPRRWTDIGDPEAIEYRWQLLRDKTTGCEINHIFDKYLGKTTQISDRLPPFKNHDKDKSYKVKDSAIIYMPEEFRRTGSPKEDFKLFLEDLKKNNNYDKDFSMQPEISDWLLGKLVDLGYPKEKHSEAFYKEWLLARYIELFTADKTENISEDTKCFIALRFLLS